MLIRSGEARSSDVDRRLAWSLAGIAGALNTAGFYAVGLYSSNMTGNVSGIADQLVLHGLALAATYLALVAAFIAGAAVSALLVNAGRRRQITGIYAFSILAEAMLLVLLALADLWLVDAGRGALLAYGLSFVMGLQNAVVTRISNARVRTTHVTGMVTDIGIELGNLADLAWQRRRPGRPGRPRDAAYDRDKLLLHGVAVLSFLAGGVIGVLAYRGFGPYCLFGAAALLALLALPGLITRQHGPTQSAETGRPPNDPRIL